jgi:hypothetical protein
MWHSTISKTSNFGTEIGNLRSRTVLLLFFNSEQLLCFVKKKYRIKSVSGDFSMDSGIRIDRLPKNFLYFFLKVHLKISLNPNFQNFRVTR